MPPPPPDNNMPDFQSLLSSIGHTGGPTYTDSHIKNAQDYEKLKLMGNDLFKKKNYELAIKAYDKAGKLGRNNVEKGTVASNQSTCHANIGEFREALKMAEFALEKRPDWEKPHYRKIVALIGLEDGDGAEEVNGIFLFR